jgi:hypothetical protein
VWYNVIGLEKKTFLWDKEQSPANSGRTKLLNPVLGSVWENKHPLLKEKNINNIMAFEGTKKKVVVVIQLSIQLVYNDLSLY